MVGSIYFIQMHYSNFREFKGRPVLVLRLTTNLKREGIVISAKDIEDGSLKKESVVIVPKITDIEAALIAQSSKIATLKEKIFQKVLQEICNKLEC